MNNAANYHEMACPDCEDGGSLVVTASLNVELVANGTDRDISDVEWDSDSAASCSTCGWSGTVRTTVDAFAAKNVENNDEESDDDVEIYDETSTG